MPEIKNYSQWSADNALGKDPIDALREYTDYARMQYLRSGVPMNTIEPELRAGVEDKLRADGRLSEETTPEQLSELQTRLFAPKTNLDFDAAVVQNYLALDDPDSETEATKNNSTLLRDYLAKKKYSAELAAPLEGAVKDLLQDSALVRRARVAAVDRGEYNAIAVTEDDGTRNVYAGARDLEDSEIPMVAESLVRSGALDTSDIVGLQDNYRKVFGGKSTLNQNARSAMFNDALNTLAKTDPEIADILGGAASAAAKQDAAAREGLGGKAAAFVVGSLAAPFVGLGDAVGAAMGLERPKPTGAEVAEYQFRQGDRTASELISQKLLENPAMRKRFSEQEISAFTNDRVLSQTDYKFDNTKPESGLRQLSTGEVNIAPALLASPQKLEDALGKAPLNEEQKEFARRQRAALLDVRVPQMLKLISSSSDEAVSAYATAKQNGVGDREFVEQWLSNEDNYGMFSNTASSFAYSGIQALGSVPIGIASLLGSETATTIMLRSQAKQARYAEYGALFGDEFGLTREALNTLPAVAVDIALTIGTAGVGRAASAAARAGYMTARTLVKGAVGVLDDAALAAVRGASAGAAAETSAALQAAGRSWISKAATTTVEEVLPVALPAFARSASSTYVSIYGSLPEDMTHEEKHKQAIGFALAAGVGTAAITAGLSALGAGGVEKLGVRTAAKGLDDLTYREAKVLFETVNNEGKAVSDKAFRDALAAEVGGNYKRLIGGAVTGFRDEAFEEALDQSINMAIEDAALKKNRPLAEKLQQVWNAGLIGGVLGGGINVASQAFTPTASAQTKALQQRTEVLDGIAKRLSTSNAPQTAASVQRMMDEANAAAVASTKQDAAAAAAQAAKAPTTAVRTVAEQLEFKFDDPRGVPPADTRLADLIGERVYIGDTGINGIAEIDTSTGEVVINFSKPTKVKDKPNVTRYVLGTKFQKATGVTLKPKIKTLAKPVGALPVGTRIFNTNKLDFVLPSLEVVNKARAAGKPLLVLQRDEKQRVVGVTIRGAALVASPTTTTDTTITDPDLIREVLRLYPEPAPAPETGEQLELDFASQDGQFEFGFMSNQAPQPTPEEVADQAELDSLGGSQEIQLTFDDAPDFDEIRGSVALIDSLIGDDPVLTALHATRIDQKGFSALASTFDPDQIADAGEALQEAQEAAAALLDDPEALSDPKRFRQNSLLFVQLNKTLDPLRVKYDRIVQIRNQTERRTRSAAKRSDAVQRSQRSATRPTAQPVGRTEGARPAGPPRDVEALTELLNADPVLAALNTTGGNNLRSLLGTFSEAQRTAAQDLLAEAEGLVAQQPAPALQQRLRILNFKLTGLNRLAATQQQPEAPAPEPTPTPEPEPTPTPAPEPEPTTPRGENRVPKLQEFMDKDPELAALVEEALAAGTDILFATSRAQAVTELGLPELPPNRKSIRTLATAFVRTDGSTGIVLYSGAMQKGKDLKKIIAHERIHVEQYRFEDTPEGAAAAAAAEATFDTESPEYDKKLDSFMRKEYPSWEKLSPRGKLREANRAAVEGLLTGETSHFKPGFFSYITRFLRHVQEVFQGDSSMATYTRAIVEQISKEAPKPAAKKAARKAAAPPPTPSPAAKKAARKAAKTEPAAEAGMQVLTDAEQLEIMALFASINNRMNKGQILGGYSGNLSQVTPAREIRRLLAAKGYKESDTPKTWVDAASIDKGSPRDIEKLNALREWAFSGGKPAPEIATAEPQAPVPTREEIEDWLNEDGSAETLVGATLLDKRGNEFKIEEVRRDEDGELEFVTDDPATATVALTVENLIDDTNPESFTPYLEAGNAEPEAGAPAPIEEKPKLEKLSDFRGEATYKYGKWRISTKKMREYRYAGGTRKETNWTSWNAYSTDPADDPTKIITGTGGADFAAKELDKLDSKKAAEPEAGAAEPEPEAPAPEPAPKPKSSSSFYGKSYGEWSDESTRQKAKLSEVQKVAMQGIQHLNSRTGDRSLSTSKRYKASDMGLGEVSYDTARSEGNLLALRKAQELGLIRDLSTNAKTFYLTGRQFLDMPTGPLPFDVFPEAFAPTPEPSTPPVDPLTSEQVEEWLSDIDNAESLIGKEITIQLVTYDESDTRRVVPTRVKITGVGKKYKIPTYRDPETGSLVELGDDHTFDPESFRPYMNLGVPANMRKPRSLESWRQSLENSGSEAPQAETYLKKKESLKLFKLSPSSASTDQIGGSHLFKTRDGELIVADKDDNNWDLRSAYNSDVTSEDEGAIDNEDALQRLSEELAEKRRQKFEEAVAKLGDTRNYPEVQALLNAGDVVSQYRLIDYANTLDPQAGTLSMLATQGDNELRQNIADIPAALQGMLPAGFTLVADPNMDGALGYNAVTAPTTVFYNPNLVGSLSVGLARADALATLRTAVDHELGHAAAEAEFGEEAYAALATELGEGMLSNIASIYYSLVELDFNLRAERIKEDRESGALPDWKIAAEWVRMEIERIANGRTSEQRMLFLRSRPSLLAKFIDALGAFVTRLRARFFEQPTTGTAASISNAARQLRKLKNGGYLPAAPKADLNYGGHAAELIGAIERGSDQTLFTMPIGAATAAGRAQVEGLWTRIGKKFQNLPPYLRDNKEERDGIMALGNNIILNFNKRFSKLTKENPAIPIDDIRTVLGRTDPTLDNAALALIQTELDAFAGKLPFDMDTVLAEEMIDKERDRLQQRERLASNNAFHQEQQSAEQRIRNAGAPALADLLVKFRTDINNMSARFTDLSPVIDENMGVYLTRTYRFHNTEGWALLAKGGIQPDGSQLGMFRGKEIDFAKLRDNAARTYEQDALAKAAKDGVVLTAEQLRDRTHEMLDKYLAKLQGSAESSPSPSQDSLQKDLTKLMPKGNINKEIMELLGVVEDPLENAVRTMVAVTKIAANNTFLRSTYDTLLSMNLASTKQTPEMGVKALRVDKDGSLSPLSDLFTTPEIANALQAEWGVNARNAERNTDSVMREGGRALMAAASFATTTKTLFSFGFYPRNAVSGQGLLLSAQGILPINGYMKEAYGLARRAYFESNERTPEQDAMIQRLIELQVLADDTQGRVAMDIMRGFVTDNEQDLDALLRDFQEATEGKPKKLLDRIGSSAAGKTYGKTVDVLASLNNWFDGAVKTQAYMYELDVLKKDNAAALAKDPLLLAQLELRAADKVKMTMPSHSRQLPIVKSLNQTSVGMVFFPFARWKTEVFRTMYNTPRLALKEIREGGPAEKARGYRRMFGFTSTLTFGGSAVGTVYAAIFRFIGGLLGEDEEKKDARELTNDEIYALRESLPVWQRGHALHTRLVGGQVQVIDMTAITPYAQLTDLFVITHEGIVNKEADWNAKRTAGYVAQQLIGTQIAATALNEVLNNSDDFGQPVYRDTDNPVEVTGKILAHFGGSALKPAALDQVMRATRGGEQDRWEIITGELIGARPRNHKMSEIEYRAFRGVKKMLDDSAQIKASLVTGRKIDEDEVVQTLEDHQESLNRTQRKLAKVMQGLQSMGSTRGGLFGSGKNAGFSAQRLALAEKGDNLRWVPNQDWLKGVYQNMTRTGEDDPMNRIRLIRRTLSGMPATYGVSE